MFRVIQILFALAILLFVSCSDDSLTISDSEDLQQTFPNQQLVEDQRIISTISQRIKDLNLSEDFSPAHLENTKIVSYDGTDIQSIIVTNDNHLSFITYTDGDKIWERGYLMRHKISNTGTQIEFFSPSKNSLGLVQIDQNNDIIAINSFDNDDNYKGWWSDWGECVGVNLNTMTNGSVGGSIYGLACIAFGPECAAGVAIGCAIGATIN